MRENVREDFPVLLNNQDMVYLDSAASSLKPKRVIDGIKKYYELYSTNIERGVYKEAYEATEIVNDARKEIAKFINAQTKEVIFTRGTTDSLNFVAIALKRILKKGDEVITSTLEHHSSFLPWLYASKEIGFKLKFVELDKDNKITIKNFKKALTKNTKVVALTHVSNVLGYKTPVEEIVKLSHEVGAIVSIDGAQAIPHERIDVKHLDVDFYSFSFHKMCGPTGLGVLYGKEELLKRLDPPEFGGEMNDEVHLDSLTFKEIPYKFEAGTLPIAEIFGAKEAVEYIDDLGYDFIHDRTIALRNFALEELKKMKEIEIYNAKEESPIISFNIKGVHSHDAVMALSDKRICIRAGHHCAEPLHDEVLCVPASLRASFYFYNTEDDVHKFINAVKEVIVFFKEVGLIA
ncbi:MAG: cysteine desulfurase [Gammaproteobacteria bacterium]|nr:cysteine desulfurase [Gammaproteobacteria bacterium]